VAAAQSPLVAGVPGIREDGLDRLGAEFVLGVVEGNEAARTHPLPKLLTDTTLRPGDIVVFPNGARVFKGTPAISISSATSPPSTRRASVHRHASCSLSCASAQTRHGAKRQGRRSLPMGDERAGLVFTDPPYNVPIDGHVCGLGQTRHREFAMGIGEMSSEVFIQPLVATRTSFAEITTKKS
jgi:hypothetical protein